jgi:4-hydroxy-tetrahydrodipicolinate synthase
MARPVELRGIGVVNATPLTPDGKLNVPEYRRHVRWLIDNGVGFLHPHAATGQGPLSTMNEYRQVLEITVEEANGQALVAAYSGRASTEETIDATRVAKEAGADATFIIQPWYSRPDDRGLYLHYKAVAEAVDIPIVIYNNPNRAGLSIPISVIQRLANDTKSIIGLKQSDLSAVVDSFGALRDVISVSPYGDAEILWGLAMGAKWSISYAANVIPAPMVRLFDAWTMGNLAEARRIFYRYLPLIRATHFEPLPSVIKYMLNSTGWSFGRPRLPIAEVSEATARVVDGLLMKAELMEPARI